MTLFADKDLPGSRRIARWRWRLVRRLLGIQKGCDFVVVEGPAMTW